MNYVKVENNIITNVVFVDEGFNAPEGYLPLPDGKWIGKKYDENVFTTDELASGISEIQQELDALLGIGGTV